MDQTKTNINDTSPNDRKEPLSSDQPLLTTTLIQSLDLFRNGSQVNSQVSDIKGLTFDPMIYFYSNPV